MRHYQNTLTGEVVSEDEYSYAAAQKGNWVLYRKIPRYMIETPPYATGRTEFDEDGKLCYWDDVKDIVRELEELKDTVRWERECRNTFAWLNNTLANVRADVEIHRSLIAARKAVEELL